MNFFHIWRNVNTLESRVRKHKLKNWHHWMYKPVRQYTLFITTDTQW
jgi:hypothetical protein